MLKTGEDRAHAPLNRQPPLCSVGFVVTTFVACLVLVVATVCFVLTYTTSTSQLRGVGRSYAESLVTTTSTRISDYFDYASTPFTGASRVFEREDVQLPSPMDDRTGYTTLKRMGRALTPLVLSAGGSVVRAAVIFNDGSAVILDFVNSSLSLFFINNALAVNRSTGLGPYEAEAYDASSNALPFVPSADLHVENSTFAYSTPPPAPLVDLLLMNPVVSRIAFFLRMQDVGSNIIAVPGCFPMRNATHVTGVGIFYLRADALEMFLASARMTRGSHIVAIDVQGVIAASTVPVPFSTTRAMTAEEAAVIEPDPYSNCWSSGDYRAFLDPNRTYYYRCRSYAKDYPYPPLQASIQSGRLFLFTTGSNYSNYALVDDSRFDIVTVDGAVYYVAAAAIRTRFTPPLVPAAFFVMLFMPEEDVLGDIAAVRRACIVATVIIFVLATGVGVAGIYAILSPIRRVARKMQQHGALSMSSDTESSAEDRGVCAEYLRLPESLMVSEVEQLQSAFEKMRTAVDSFERYVPRTVVKELIGAGNLCHIAMEHRACTVMFTEISGFGDMCQGIQPALLAPLLQQYFACTSRIVADVDGVVDKFLGDTIMIVWGAPRATAAREENAVRAGLLIVRAAKQTPLDDGFRAVGHTLRIRVGVATGLVLAGNMGSSERMNYTVVGDAVSVASQLLEWCRAFSMRLLIDNATAQACGDTLCAHRVPLTPFAAPPFFVLGLRSSHSSSTPELAVGDDVEAVTKLTDAACVAFLEGRLDDTMSFLEDVDDIRQDRPTSSRYRMLLREAATGRLLSMPSSADY